MYVIAAPENQTAPGEHAEMKAKPPHKGMDLETAQKQKGIAWPDTPGAPPLSSSPSGVGCLGAVWEDSGPLQLSRHP